MNAVKPKLLLPSHDGYIMNWGLNHLCNYRCHYCWHSDEHLSTEHPLCGEYSPEHIAECFDKTGKVWLIKLSGGEPFLYPDFVNLASSLTKNHYIAINTNLSHTNNIEFADIINPKKVKTINASLHIYEREKHHNGLKIFLHNARYLQKKGFRLIVEYVIHPTLFERLEDDMKMLSEEGIQIVNLKAFRGYYESKKYPDAYTANEREIFEEHSVSETELNLTNKLFTFTGKYCNAGVTYVSMDAGGEVSRCTTSTKVYGNFFKDEITFDETARSCPFPKCGSPYEGMILIDDTKGINPLNTIKEVFREGPSYISKKAKPSVISGYLRRRRTNTIRRQSK